ncbi:hypothetical protein [Oleiharenicola lentus]|uniref:hypothetical protein n=1 Tax=Oleiharenicola lentus TaxID=2508720 RepID=UPI003F66B7A2
MRNGHFTIKRENVFIPQRVDTRCGVKITTGPFEYWTYRLTGWLRGRRIRKQFKSIEEAEGAKNRYEVAAANVRDDVRAVATRLDAKQIGEAEAAFHRLGKHTLSFAVDWFLANYRPPSTPSGIAEAVQAFTDLHLPLVSFYVARDYKRELAALCAAFPAREVHSISTEEVHAYLARRHVGKKAWNNIRGSLHAFFEFCRVAPRKWCEENPVGPIIKHRISRGIPEILSAARAAEVMAFLENWRGGSLVPYFALCLFAGIRPTVPRGEVWKLGKISPAQMPRIVDSANGVIRISPDVSKTRDLRQITIQSNLRLWLECYPLDRYPIVIPSMKKRVTEVRMKLGLTADVLRHTFISMHVAKFKSLGAAALEAGNSESIIKRHYLNLVTAEETSLFWQIQPRGDAFAESRHRLEIFKDVAKKVVI